MKPMEKTGLVALGLVCALFALTAVPVAAAENDHSYYLQGPMETGQDVTRQCLKCHEKIAVDFMQTVHWTWAQKQTVDGKEVVRGKKNAINNFCTSIAGNEPRCTSCHAGYGWRDDSFDFGKAENVDCLVCHDTTGTYVKEATGAGNPAKRVDLVYVAQSVGKPSRFNCGTCHFYGGGGDAVKHGDLDSSMEYPSRAVDVHMDADGNDFTCQECHVTEKHAIPGSSLAVSPGGTSHFSCGNCHGEAPHAQSRLNRHAADISCQTCHIPFYAKEVPTKLSWDWSTTGQSLPAETDEYGKQAYDKKKGHFTWGKMVVPEYLWYNGSASAYNRGGRIDPDKVTYLTLPNGSIKDANAKIHPFKLHSGKQIYDRKNKYLITAKVFGEGGYWSDYDWDKAARLGMEASGLPYSGEYGFAPTEMYWSINHMVSPTEEALGCLDCHGDNGRMNWTALGYPGDPMDNPKHARSR
ncbi:MAG: tetrathionate reductase family octaheme c-type cytochrome [Desulfuromonadales bacterium]|nr:tetrathionate reductase family octaheme c-type cytochrome [Desulfuromonadales bacterium]